MKLYAVVHADKPNEPVTDITNGPVIYTDKTGADLYAGQRGKRRRVRPVQLVFLDDEPAAVLENKPRTRGGKKARK
jgi:hypothetical protein